MQLKLLLFLLKTGVEKNSEIWKAIKSNASAVVHHKAIMQQNRTEPKHIIIIIISNPRKNEGKKKNSEIENAGKLLLLLLLLFINTITIVINDKISLPWVKLHGHVAYIIVNHIKRVVTQMWF